MTTPPQQPTAPHREPGLSTLPEPLAFPRLQLPPVPVFRDADGEVRRVLDAPPSQWQSPLPAADPETEYRYRVAPPPPAPAVAAPPPAPLPAGHSPVAVPVGVPVPEPEPAPPVAESPVASSRIAPVLLLTCALLLAWASQMAFSSALLALAALLVAQLAAAAAVVRCDRLPLVAAGGAAILAVLAAKGAAGQFSEMAFVAGLFVIAACVPTLLLLAGAQLVLRRRSDRRSPADDALHSAWVPRAVAVAAVLAAGVQAHRTYSAVPDAIVTFAVVALAARTLRCVLRGRAA